MPSCNIIVDSCSYFRLAQNIRPLLKNPFGREKYCLGVIEELDKEYEKNPTLKNKFFWVSQNEYSHNRKKCFSPNIRQRSEINHAFFKTNASINCVRASRPVKAVKGGGMDSVNKGSNHGETGQHQGATHADLNTMFRRAYNCIACNFSPGTGRGRDRYIGSGRFEDLFAVAYNLQVIQEAPIISQKCRNCFARIEDASPTHAYDNIAPGLAGPVPPLQALSPLWVPRIR